jgi:hypothetical protein
MCTRREEMTAVGFEPGSLRSAMCIRREEMTAVGFEPGSLRSAVCTLEAVLCSVLICALLCRAVMLSGASNRTIFWRVFGELLVVIFGFATEIPTLLRWPSGASDLLC